MKSPWRVRFTDDLENNLGLDPTDMIRFFDLIAARIRGERDGRQPVVFFFTAMEWIGHLCQDMHIVKSLFDSSAHQLFVVGNRPSMAINFSIADVALRDAVFIETEPALALFNVQLGKVVFKQGMVYRHGDIYFLFGGHGDSLRRAYSGHIAATQQRISTFRLTADEEDRRAALFGRLGIDVGERLAVIHVRSSGYWQTRIPASTEVNAFRDADIDNYRRMIHLLIDEGYFVARIGDAQSPPLDGFRDRVLDAPHHPAYDPFLDVALISRCQFLAHAASGPTDLARGFGRPLFGINVPFQSFWPLDPDELFLPKLYVNEFNQEALSIPEILNLDLASVTDTKELAWSGVSVRQNTPEEIREATVEFLEGLASGSTWATPASVGYRKIAKDEHEIRRLQSQDPRPFRCYFSMWQPRAGLAEAARMRNPGLLEGELLPLGERPQVIR